MSPDPEWPTGDDWKPMNCPAGCHTVVGRNPQVAANLPIPTWRKQGRGKRETHREKQANT